MAQEEHQRCSNSSGGSGGGRVSKKVKHKKIPQRGLGVAQLEKIRLEEIHKKDAAAAPPTRATVIGSSSPLVYLPLPQHHNQPLSFSPTELRSARPSLRPNFEAFRSFSPLPSPSLGIVYGNPSVRSGSAIGGHSYFPSSSSSCELSYDRDGFKYQSRLHNDFNSIGPSSTMMQKQYHRQQENHSSKANESKPISSGLNLQIEFPSNQSYHSNYTIPHCPEDEKILGMKRPCPFSQDKAPNTAFHCSFTPSVPPISGLEQISLYDIGGTSFEPRHSFLSEGPSGFGSNQLDRRTGVPELNLKNGSKENGGLDTALTLGSPTATSSSTKLKAKQPLEFPTPLHQESSKVPPHQEYLGEPLFRRGDPIQSQHIYNFFPPKTQQNGHLAANSGGDRRSEKNDLDLNLKL